ncbi:MAG: hypothetical protein JJE04_18700 [Acidobacteriia bacterium]|nr:hypothetical protein [Terriglobia bacterium]
MDPKQQPLFDADFHTARQPNALFCHPDFLERLDSYRTQPVGKRAALLLQRLLIDPERLHYKATHGENKGWRRSRLGGSSGSHFYAWWAPQGALPLKAQPGFEKAPPGSLFLRDIRHHDHHAPLPAHGFPDDYLLISVPEVRREEYGPAPWTQQQSKFAGARDAVRILKGHPGSGKTTALLHAADSTSARHILYLTYSSDLAALAQAFFDRYCSADRKYHVRTYPQFARELLGVDLPRTPLPELRARFKNDVALRGRTLGPWADNVPALFDEFHAHLIGAALPVKIGRFPANLFPRMDDGGYRGRRTRFIGATAVDAALSTANRMEKTGGLLAARFFPDLQLAWSMVQKLPDIPAASLPWDCIALDECQDLTPIESFLVARLAKRLGELRGLPVPVLIAGDEAQTVRPTDFEWAWLNDIFHAEVSTPSEHKLLSNLRSPRQIAELVNRVWDLYAHLEKRDRPSGQGWASIEDDATDQVLYCAAAPGEDLNTLLADLASREGLAIVCFGEPPAGFPQTLRANALTPAEVKGLDFHSVCVIDAGEQIEKITSARALAGGVESLSRRLAIDQLRVALSRPTERLIWLDISPKGKRVAVSLGFLNGERAENQIHSAIAPAALLKALQEENLDLEERIQRCQEDARQYVAIRPDLAWSRAHQAVTLLGKEGELNAVQDPLARRTAHATLSEVCFTLAMRKVRLSPELGSPNLIMESATAAARAVLPELALVLWPVSRIGMLRDGDELNAMAEAMETIVAHKDRLPPWFFLELGQEPVRWIAALERVITAGANATIGLRLLPPFFEAMQLPDAAVRTTKLRKTAIDHLIKTKQYRVALATLAALPERNYKLEAQCQEGLGDFVGAAAAYRCLGDLESALDCYRKVPDIKLALGAIKELGKPNAAAASLEWVAEMQALAAKRPDNFNRVMKPTEKKLLEQVLEQSLGVQRKKPAVKKVAVKRTPKRGPEPF